MSTVAVDEPSVGSIHWPPVAMVPPKDKVKVNDSVPSTIESEVIEYVIVAVVSPATKFTSAIIGGSETSSAYVAVPSVAVRAKNELIRNC